MKKWIFDFSPNAEHKGLSDSGIETFRGDPVKSLAREICQNSLDAVIDNKIAKVEFKVFDIEREKFFGIDSFGESVERAYNYWKEGKEKKFLKNALTALKKDKIKFLRISDFNTTGLIGVKDSDVQTSKFMKLIKSSGVSTKSGNSGGSFGIGKFAPFACSNLRTVFYSTYNINNEKGALGVSRLVSFKNDDENICDGRGFCGLNESSKPIDDVINLDPNFSRLDRVYGTDIYVAAFNNDEEWINDLISSLLDSFLVAFYENKLEVKVGDEIINKASLDYIVKKYKNYLNSITRNSYRVLIDENAQTHVIPFKFGGKLILNILQDNNLNKKITMIKSRGMKIKDYSYNGHIYFSAICKIEGVELNDYLLSIENPAHNQWQPERKETRKEKQEAKEVLASMRQLIMDKINEVFIKKDIDTINIEGLDILQQEDDVDNQEGEIGAGLSDSIKQVEITVKEKPRAVTAQKYKNYGDEIESLERQDGTTIDDEGYDKDSRDGEGKGKRKKLDADNGGKAGAGNDSIKKAVSVKSKKIRIICTNKNLGKYTLIFKASEDAYEGFIVLYKVDEQGAMEPVLIKSAFKDDEQLKIFDNKIFNINFDSEKSIKIDLELDEKDYISLEVKAYADKS